MMASVDALVSLRCVYSQFWTLRVNSAVSLGSVFFAVTINVLIVPSFSSSTLASSPLATFLTNLSSSAASSRRRRVV